MFADVSRFTPKQIADVTPLGGAQTFSVVQSSFVFLSFFELAAEPSCLDTFQEKILSPGIWSFVQKNVLEPRRIRLDLTPVGS